MKKKWLSLVAAVFTIGTLAGCNAVDWEVATNSDLKDLDVEKYVTLCEYKGLTVEVAPVVVTKEQQDQLLLDVYQSNVTADYGVYNRPVVNGDIVIIDYVGKMDGVAFDGGTASDQSLGIGSGSFIAGFEEGLIGVTPGETVDLNLTFPSDYHAVEMQNKSVVFTVTLDYILPGLDEMKDAMVANLGIPDVGTVEELRQYVNDYLDESAADTYLYNIQDAIMQQLMQGSTIEELPEAFVESYNHVFSESLDYNGARYGVDGETYCQYFYGMSSADYISLYSEMQARQEILLQTIANKENLNISDEELDPMLEERATEYGAPSVEELLGNTTKDEYRNYFMSERVMEFLVENTTVVEPKAE